MVNRRTNARSYSQRFYCYKPLVRIIEPNRIPQRPAESFEGNRHHVAVLQLQAILEAEHVGAEKVDVHIARAAVLGVFEVMVLEITHRMAHPLLASRLCRLPDDLSA